MIKLFGLRAKTYAYLMDDDGEHKNPREQKRGLMVNNYKNCFFNDKTILKLQQRFKSDCHNVYAE